MNIQRLQPQQLLADGPLESVREAIWYAFHEAGVSNIVIDVDKNVVVGSTGANMGTYGQNITATLETRADGTLISVKSEAQVQGSIDFGKSRRQAKDLTDAIEGFLQRRDLPRSTNFGEPLVAQSSPVAPAPPIADPTGAFDVARPTGPVYGMAMPPKRGTAVLIYGLLGVSCCQIAGPFA